MPRFHFNVEDGSSYPDHEGTELPDVPAAKAHAVWYFGDMLKASPCTFWNGDDWRMEVADEVGLALFSLHFVEIDSPALGVAEKVRLRGQEA